MAERWIAVYPQATRLVFTGRTPREVGRMLAQGLQSARDRYHAEVTDWRWQGNGFRLAWSDGLEELYYVGWETDRGLSRDLTHEEKAEFDNDFFRVLRG